MHQYKRPRIKNPKERPHYLTITSYVYRNRFVIANQVQRRFKTYLKSDRTARRHLAELEALGYLGVAVTRGVSPLWPKVYFCRQRGARRLREALRAKGKSAHFIRLDRSRRIGHSSDHILHELLITEFLLTLWESAQANTDHELLRIERRSLPSQPAFSILDHGKSTRIEPDAMFLCRYRSRGMMCYFVEIDTGSMTPKQLMAKFRRYELWSRSSPGRDFLTQLYSRNGAAKPHPTFRLSLVSCGQPGQDPRLRLRKIAATAAPFSTVSHVLRLLSSTELASATPADSITAQANDGLIGRLLCAYDVRVFPAD